MRALSPALAIVLLSVATSAAHEERLAVGRVETIDAAKRVLVVAPADAGERRRLELTPETEVFVCRAAGRPALRAGQTVRVKYLDKPGSVPEAQSILVRGSGR